MNNLSALLSNKVLKDQQLANIKYDSIMSENIPTQLLLGVNVSANNKKDNLIKNIIMNHNKVTNFVKLDLGKKEDEYGLPVMIIPPNELKNKEISYFYGIPISKKVSVSDNSFSFRTQNATQAFVIYYKGNFAGRTKAIQQLMQKAKSENMRNGDIVESFVETPEEGKDCMMKIILPVYH
jgi:effector-binding domain-containing protein